MQVGRLRPREMVASMHPRLSKGAECAIAQLSLHLQRCGAETWSQRLARYARGDGRQCGLNPTLGATRMSQTPAQGKTPPAHAWIRLSIVRSLPPNRGGNHSVHPRPLTLMHMAAFRSRPRSIHALAQKVERDSRREAKCYWVKTDCVPRESLGFGRGRSRGQRDRVPPRRSDGGACGHAGRGGGTCHRRIRWSTCCVDTVITE